MSYQEQQIVLHHTLPGCGLLGSISIPRQVSVSNLDQPPEAG